jgi:hypothetical protein
MLLPLTAALLLSAANGASAAPIETYSAPLALGSWRPTPTEWVNALDVFKHEYPRWEHDSGRKLRDLGEYRFQYYGVSGKGRRLVFLNAFCSEHWDRAPRWRTRLVAVDGGGSCFFRAKVDVATGSIVELTMNQEGALRADPGAKSPAGGSSAGP